MANDAGSQRKTDDRSVLIDALIGAAVTAVLSFVPLSPVLGGGVSGYLHGDRGGWVGALSGLLAALPLVLFLWLILGIFSFVLSTANVPEGSLLFGVFFVLVVVFAAVYTIALGALGGYLGVAVADGRFR